MEYALLLMETLVDMVGSVEARDEEFSSQDTADPIVYQLVRVQLYAFLMNNFCRILFQVVINGKMYLYFDLGLLCSFNPLVY